jgi:hypothetical protein
MGSPKHIRSLHLNCLIIRATQGSNPRHPGDNDVTLMVEVEELLSKPPLVYVYISTTYPIPTPRLSSAIKQ